MRKISSTSALCMRMQPSLAEVPMEASSTVPWMPMPLTRGVLPVASRRIQRVPRMLPGWPGPMGALPAGYQVGSVSFSVMTKVPTGVLPFSPVQTG